MLQDVVTPHADVVSNELKEAVDWSLQELLKRAKQRPKLQNPLLYLSQKLQEYSDTKRNTIHDGESDAIKKSLGSRIGRRDFIFDSGVQGKVAGKSQKASTLIIPEKNTDNGEGATKTEEKKEEAIAGEKAVSETSKSKDGAVNAEDATASKVSAVTTPAEFDDEQQTIIDHTVFQKHLLFKDLSKTNITNLLLAMEEKTYKKGDVVYRATEDANFAFVLISGEFETSVPKNEFIGIANLMYANKSTITLVVSSQKLTLKILPRNIFKSILLENGKRQLEEHYTIIRESPFFQTLKNSEIKQLVNGLKIKTFTVDDEIFQVCDSMAEDLYIIKNGTIEIQDHNETKILSKGDVFGDEVLTSPDFPYSRRVTAVSKSINTEVLTTNYKCFNRLLGSMLKFIKRDPKMYKIYEEEIDPSLIVPLNGRRGRREKIYDFDTTFPNNEESNSTSNRRKLKKSEERVEMEKEAKKVLKQNDYFSFNYDNNQISQIVQAMEEEEFEAGSAIVQKGEVSNKLYVVVDGDVIDKDNHTSSLFGQKNMLSDHQWDKTLRALDNLEDGTTCFSITRGNFKRSVRSAILKRNADIMKSLKIKVFKVLTDKELLKICDFVKTKFYNGDTVIINQDDLIDNMHIVVQGEIESSKKGGKSKILKKGDYFAEMALMGQIPSPVTYTTKKKSKVFLINRDHFVRLLGPFKVLMTRSPRLYAEFDRRYRGSQSNKSQQKLKK
eukprot:g2880.t1